MYYGDTESVYIEKTWDALDKAVLVGDKLCQGENDYKSGGIFYGWYLVRKRQSVLTMDGCVIFIEHKRFKAFNDMKRLLDRSQ